MAKSIATPPPYKGEVDKVPISEIENPYAQVVDNFALDTGVPTLRHGSPLFCAGSGVFSNAAFCMAKYGTTALFEVYQDLLGPPVYIVDVTSGTPSVVRTVAGGMVTKATSLYFNKYLYIMGDGALATVQSFDGTTWAAAGYSWPGGFTPFGGNVFKNRAYFIGLNSATYGYSGADKISGAVTLVDLSSIISVSANLIGIQSIALSRPLDISAPVTNVQCFIFDSGEILYYGGSYPDDDSWSLIGRFIIPRPQGYNAFVQAYEDVYAITEAGPISLTTLFQQKEQVAVFQDPQDLIPNRWTQIFNGNATIIGALFDQRRDRLVIGFNTYVARPGQAYPAATGGTFFFVIFSFKTQAWFEYFGTIKSSLGGGSISVAACAYFGNEVYFITSREATVISLETASDYQDIDVVGTACNYDYNLVSAPISSSKFGANQITGIEVIMQSDLYGQTNFDIIGDLGRITTGAQKIENQGSTILKPMANVGLSDVSYAQIQISGTTTSGKSVGLSINAFNVWYDPGVPGSR